MPPNLYVDEYIPEKSKVRLSTSGFYRFLGSLAEKAEAKPEPPDSPSVQ